MEGVTNEKEEIFLIAKPDSFTLGTITIPETKNS
jgi:hypothetical protein